MALRDVAQSDLAKIIGDTGASGQSITITDPAGNSAAVTGMTNDVSQIIDPDTGVAVSGQFISVALRISTLTSVGFSSLPANTTDESSPPWLLTFADVNGNSETYKVRQADPDRTLGMVTMIVEHYS